MFTSPPTAVAPDSFEREYVNYLENGIVTLNKAAPNDFYPSLSTLKILVDTFNFAR